MTTSVMRLPDMPGSLAPCRTEYAARAAAGHSAPPRPAAGPAGNVFIAPLAAVLLVASQLPAAPTAVAAVPAACDAPTHATVLRPAMHTAADARGYWLDRGLLRWPGVAADAPGRFRLHHSARAAIAAPVGGRVAGSEGAIELSIPDHVPAALVERFGFTGEGIELAVDVRDQAALPQLLRGQLLLVHEDDDGRVLDATHLQLPGALDDWYATAAVDGAPPLGPVLEEQASVLRAWAPTARAMSLCLHDDPDGRATAHLPMFREDATGTWSRHVDDDLSGKAYTYLVDVFVPGTGSCATASPTRMRWRSRPTACAACSVDLDAAALKPDGWDAAPRGPRRSPRTDMAIYELHVRDFSIANDAQRAPGAGAASTWPSPSRDSARHAPPARAGRGRHHRRAPAAGVRHRHHSRDRLRHADIRMPRAEQRGRSRRSSAMHRRSATASTGATTRGTSPRPRAASPATPTTARCASASSGDGEALHAIGLRVGMDVVYNHTTASGQAPKSVLDRIVPGYYHRLDADGAVERSTCCDNTATEHAMMARLMIDSAVLWVRDYRIDSFRFDLMGHQPRAAMERLQAR
jgi:pullulanase